MVFAVCIATTAVQAAGNGNQLTRTSLRPGWTAESLPAWARPTDRYSTAYLSCHSGGACAGTVTTAAFAKAGTIYTRNGTMWFGRPHTYVTKVGNTKYVLPYGFGIPSCLSASRCVAPAQSSGAGSDIAQTLDGGRTWRIIFRSAAPTKGPVLPKLNSLACLSASICFGVGFQGISPYAAELVRTPDGGRHWSYLARPRAYGLDQNGEGLVSVSCLTLRSCWIAGTATNTSNVARAVVFHTSNGGTSWSAHAFPTGWGNARQVVCVNPFDCWALVGPGGAYAGIVFQTTNGGRRWFADSASNTGSPIFNLSCVNFLDCWASGGSGSVLVTTNGGSRWTAQAVAGAGTIHWVSCPNAGRCWATADVGSGQGAGLHVLVTADGGFQRPLPKPPAGRRLKRDAPGVLSLNWHAVPGAARYDVYEASSSGLFTSPSPIATVHGTSTTVRRLKPGDVYAFEITSADAAGSQSPPSAPVSGRA
jgi:photosystem II stability/assembly factor-like uncharacterized protein